MRARGHRAAANAAVAKPAVVILRMKSLGLGDVEEFPFVDPPPSTNAATWPEKGTPAVTAAAFHSKKDNVSVLWLDGLDYLPETADLK